MSGFVRRVVLQGAERLADGLRASLSLICPKRNAPEILTGGPANASGNGSAVDYLPSIDWASNCTS